jgi:choice-of-anchor A domain-containing protein
MIPTTFVARLLPVLLGSTMMCSAHAAVSTIDLGLASGYSGFFYGNVSNVVDVEGRLAVGGDLSTSGLSVGYRTPYGVTGPSLVVGGSVKVTGGDIFNGPTTNVDTNASVGPTTAKYDKQTGYGVYGGAKTGSSGYHDLRQQTGVVDFAAAQVQLTKLSSDLSKTAANGKVESKWNGLYLTGDNTSDLQVFNVDSNQLGNLVLENVKSTASVVINVTGSGRVTFSGGQDGQMESMRDRLIYNLVNATDISMSTFAYGTVLANNAVLSGGSGHLEGSIIAKGMSTKVEIGFEPYKPYLPTSPVPEPETYAMLLAGLGLVGFLARRRKAA